METRATVKDISVDYKTRKTRCILETDASPSVLEQLIGKDLTVELKEYRKKRTIDANSYYWVLLGKLADKMNEAKPLVHNLLLRRYGQLETMDGKVMPVVLPDTDETGKKCDLSETFHLKPTHEVRLGKDQRIYRTWLILKGSHDLNTAEFSKLLNGLVDECKEQGIETMTPDEIRRMMEAYGKHHQSK